MAATIPNADDVFEAIACNRHSCRKFLPDPLLPEQTQRLMELAQRAPSDCNTQPWITYLVQGNRLEALRESLYRQAVAGLPSDSDIAPIEQYEGIMLERRRACGWGLYEAVGIKKGDRIASRTQALENFRFFGAPHVALITSEASMGERGVFDAGIYTGYFLLAAQSLGIAAIPQAAISHYSRHLRAELDIPESHRIIIAISFGREDDTHPANTFRTDRAPVEDAVIVA